MTIEIVNSVTQMTRHSDLRSRRESTELNIAIVVGRDELADCADRASCLADQPAQ